MRRQYRLLSVLLMGAVWLTVSGFSLPGAFERMCSAGYRLFHRGDAAASAQAYERAVKERPEDPVANFDYGAALYRNQKYQEALDAFTKAAKSTDPALQQSAEYNMGNAAYRMQQFDKALEHYKRSLCLKPDDPDAKYNLEMALKQQQQKKQNEQSQSGNKDDKKNPPPPKPQKQDQPQSKQDKLDKQEADRLLKSTAGDDERLQRELRRAPVTDKPTRGKDW